MDPSLFISSRFSVFDDDPAATTNAEFEGVLYLPNTICSGVFKTIFELI